MVTFFAPKASPWPPALEASWVILSVAEAVEVVVFPVKVTVAVRSFPLLAFTATVMMAPLLDTPPLVMLTVAQSESDSAVQLQFVVSVTKVELAFSANANVDGDTVTEADSSFCGSFCSPPQEASRQLIPNAAIIKCLSLIKKR